MAYVIGDDCIACGTCQGECPVEAISEGVQSIQISAQSVVLALVYVLLRLSAWANHLSKQTKFKPLDIERLFYYSLFLQIENQLTNEYSVFSVLVYRNHLAILVGGIFERWHIGVGMSAKHKVAALCKT